MTIFVCCKIQFSFSLNTFAATLTHNNKNTHTNHFHQNTNTHNFANTNTHLYITLNYKNRFVGFYDYDFHIMKTAEQFGKRAEIESVNILVV